MPQTALMPGNEDRVGYWLTPPEIMKPLQEEFEFNFDPCPYPRPAGWNGLKEEWGDRNYVNPPFTGTSLAAWTKKAIAERAKGKLVVMILPLDRWVRYLFEAKAEMRYIGNVEWINPAGNRRLHGSRPNFLFILRPIPSRSPEAERESG